MAKQRVLIRACDTYDKTRLGEIVADGLDRFGLAPAGDVFIKPNVVYAHYDTARFGDTAYTHPELLAATTRVAAAKAGVRRVTIGEKSGISFPTRLNYSLAGYYRMIRELTRERWGIPIRLLCLEEDPEVIRFVGGKIHSWLKLSRTVAKADFKIYTPKLKKHTTELITGAVKLNVGICADDERAIRHDYMLPEKICDLLTASSPDFIVMDAIDVGVGAEIFPYKRHLGAVIMGTNPVAVDMVGAHLYGIDPAAVPHLVTCAKAGHGPASLDEIDIIGDFEGEGALEGLMDRIKPYDDDFYAWHDGVKELERIGCPVRHYLGPYDRKHPDKICKSGCEMGFELVLMATYFSDQEGMKRARPITVIVGKQDEPIDAHGETAILLGDCAEAEIRNASKVVEVRNCFVTPSDFLFVFSYYAKVKNFLLEPRFALTFAYHFTVSVFVKVVRGFYFNRLLLFLKRTLLKKI